MSQLPQDPNYGLGELTLNEDGSLTRTLEDGQTFVTRPGDATYDLVRGEYEMYQAGLPAQLGTHPAAKM